MTTNSMESIRQFLACRRIAIAGASRKEKDYSRAVMDELSRCGYEVVPVNPGAEEIGGLRSFAAVGEIEPPPEAVIVLVPESEVIETTVQCVRAGIRMIWFRREEKASQAYRSAVSEAKQSGATVIAGECPLMFLPNVAWFHRLHGFVNRISGAYPA